MHKIVEIKWNDFSRVTIRLMCVAAIIMNVEAMAMDRNSLLDDTFDAPNFDLPSNPDNTNLENFNSQVSTVEVQQNGKILLGGEFKKIGDGPSGVIVRLNPDGSLDSSFIPSEEFQSSNQEITQIIEQSDQKILVVGRSEFNPVASRERSITRLNPDGSVDTAFKENVGLSIKVFNNHPRINLLQDGRILLSGNVVLRQPPLYDAASEQTVLAAIIDPSGLATPFNTGVALGDINSFAQQSDGKILVSNGTILIRLLSDLSIDTSFTTVSLGSTISKITVGQDDTIYAIGSFPFLSTVAGRSIDVSLIKLNPDGSLDGLYNEVIRRQRESDAVNSNTFIMSNFVPLPTGELLFEVTSIVSLFDPPSVDITSGFGRLDRDGNRNTSLLFLDDNQVEFGVQPDGRVLVAKKGQTPLYFLSPNEIIVRLARSDSSNFNDSLEFVANWSTAGSLGFKDEFGSEAFDKSDAVRSGAIDDNQLSYIEMRLTDGGELSFMWRVSSELNGDYFAVLINGQEVDKISGEIPWTEKKVDLPEGSNTIRWVYNKNQSLSAGLDAAFLDTVSFKPNESDCFPVKTNSDKVALVCL